MAKKNDLVADSNKDEIISVQVHEKDLEALVQLLNITSDTFLKVVGSAMLQADEKSVQLFSARAKLATAFAERFNQFLDFAEPASKELH